MLAIISPAKTLDFKTNIDGFAFSQPNLTACSQELIDICKQLSPAELGSLMSISDKLAALNVARFASGSLSITNKMPKPPSLPLKVMFIPD